MKILKKGREGGNKDFSTPDILFQMSPRILPNERKERTRSRRRMELGLVLSQVSDSLPTPPAPHLT
jgi:hypothetical protein